VRFLAAKVRWNLCRDHSFVFDAVLVLVMVWELWVAPVIAALFMSNTRSGGWVGSSLVLRSFRIFRLGRTHTFLRNFPELWVFMKGLLLGMRALFATMCSLLFLIYVFGIAFKLLMSDMQDSHASFASLPIAMNTLFIASITSIDKNFLGKMLSIGWLYWGLWLLYLLVANLAIMKMMTGVLVNVVTDVTRKFKDDGNMRTLTDQLGQHLKEFDSNQDGTVSKEEFDVMLMDDRLVRCLLDLGVDVIAFVEFACPSFPEEGLTTAELAQTMLKFRGQRGATFKDIVDMRVFVKRFGLEMHQRNLA